MNKKRKLQNNKNVNDYECLLKRILYCPGNGQELLSVFGVTQVCHASNHRPTSCIKFAIQIVRGVILGKLAELLIPEKRTFEKHQNCGQMF